MDSPDYAIDVDVATRFLDDQSAPEDGRYVFAYTIRIHNRGRVPAQLLRRHWVITDANGEVQEVRGPGVVGEQPRLAPGQSFEYTSGCPLSTPFGSMHGSYQMVLSDGEQFDAEIGAFSLSQPHSVQ